MTNFKDAADLAKTKADRLLGFENVVGTKKHLKNRLVLMENHADALAKKPGDLDQAITLASDVATATQISKTVKAVKFAEELTELSKGMAEKSPQGAAVQVAGVANYLRTYETATAAAERKKKGMASGELAPVLDATEDKKLIAELQELETAAKQLAMEVTKNGSKAYTPDETKKINAAFDEAIASTVRPAYKEQLTAAKKAFAEEVDNVKQKFPAEVKAGEPEKPKGQISPAKETSASPNADTDPATALSAVAIKALDTRAGSKKLLDQKADKALIDSLDDLRTESKAVGDGVTKKGTHEYDAENIKLLRAKLDKAIEEARKSDKYSGILAKLEGAKKSFNESEPVKALENNKQSSIGPKPEGLSDEMARVAVAGSKGVSNALPNLPYDDAGDPKLLPIIPGVSNGTGIV